MATVSRQDSVQHDTTSYILPHHSNEQRRLSEQSKAIWTTFGNRHVHAPIPAGASLMVDVGCGTGAVGQSLAEDYPRAKVVGVDLGDVPAADITLPNYSFIKADIMESAGKHSSLQANTADLVFSRLLVGGMSGGKWPAYVKSLADLVKPGGYLDMVDINVQMYQCTDPVRLMETKKPIQIDAFKYVMPAADEVGLDFHCGANLEKYMKEAGLEDIEVRVYPWCFGGWAGEHHPELAGWGSIGNQGQGLAEGLIGLLKAKCPKDKLEAKHKEIIDLMNGTDERKCFMDLYAVTGRKPT